MSKKRVDLNSLVISGRSNAVGQKIKFLNNDYAPITNEVLNLKNLTGTIVDWDYTDFQNTLYIELDNKVDMLDEWDNVLQLDLNHYHDAKVHIYKYS